MQDFLGKSHFTMRDKNGSLAMNHVQFRIITSMFGRRKRAWREHLVRNPYFEMWGINGFFFRIVFTWGWESSDFVRSGDCSVSNIFASKSWNCFLHYIHSLYPNILSLSHSLSPSISLYLSLPLPLSLPPNNTDINNHKNISRDDV